MAGAAERKDVRLDVVRCLMNYMVVLLHASAAFQYVQRSGFEFWAWTFVCSHLCWMSIPAFFLISGYLLFKGFEFAVWPKKMLGRVKRLAVPYVAWNILFVAFYLSAANVVPRLASRVESFGLRTIGGACSKIIGLTSAPIDGPLWFLRTLFFFALVSPVLWLLVRKIGAWTVLGLSVVWVILESFLGLTDALALVFPAYSIACLLLGCALAVSQKSIFEVFRGKKWVAISFAACVFRASIFMLGGSAWMMDHEWLRLVIPWLPIVEAPGLIALCSSLPLHRVLSHPVYRCFQTMGFFAYAGHFLFCSVFLHLMAPCFKDWTAGKLTVLVVVFVIGGIVAMAVAYGLLRRLLPRVLQIVDGRL